MSHPAELLTPSCCRACSNLDVPLPCVRGLGLPLRHNMVPSGQRLGFKHAAVHIEMYLCISPERSLADTRQAPQLLNTRSKSPFSITRDCATAGLRSATVLILTLAAWLSGSRSS